MSGNSQIAKNKNIMSDLFFRNGKNFEAHWFLRANIYLPNGSFPNLQNLLKSNDCMHFMSYINIITSIPLNL